MRYINEKEFIDSEFPLKVRSQITSAIYMGYEMVTQLVKDNNWLQSVYGKNTYGILRNAAVSFCIDRKIAENGLNISSKSVTNSRKNFNYIQLFTGNSIINISQVKSPNAIPRYADFRYENSLVNGQVELYIEKDIAQILEKSRTNEVNYMILTHGCFNNVPAFVHIGIPTVGADSWRYQYNLLRDPHVIEKNDEEQIKSVLPTFKEQLVKGVFGDGEKL